MVNEAGMMYRRIGWSLPQRVGMSLVKNTSSNVGMREKALECCLNRMMLLVVVGGRMQLGMS